jgi:cobalt-zinc-cadmium efflux system outer membrane protein
LDGQALVTTAWAELDALHQAFEQIRDALEPQSEAVLRATAEGYRQGRYSLLELTTAQQERLAWQQRRIAVATEYHQTRIELERLLGRSLDQEIAG